MPEKIADSPKRIGLKNIIRVRTLVNAFCSGVKPGTISSTRKGARIAKITDIKIRPIRKKVKTLLVNSWALSLLFFDLLRKNRQESGHYSSGNQDSVNEIGDSEGGKIDVGLALR